MSNSSDQPATGGDATALLEVRGLRKSFSGNVVLSDVDLAVLAGEVHAIVGENGAGKSTLIKVLAGVYQPDAGQLFREGRELRLSSPRAAFEHGLVVIHQELSLAPHLSAGENIFFGHYPTTRLCPIHRARMHRRPRELLDTLRISID